MSGLELAIQVAETCPACRIILFSGLVSVEEMEAMCRTRHSDFALLEKPLHPDLLLARIADLLQSSPTASSDGLGK